MFSGLNLPGDKITVTLVVFSGRPDPKWTILSTDPSYKEIVAQLQKAKIAKLTYEPKDMPPRLGYKGFLVEDTEKKEWVLIVGPKTVPLQQLLLKTMPKGSIPAATLKSVSEEIKKGEVSAVLQVTKRLHPTISQVRGMATVVDCHVTIATTTQMTEPLIPSHNRGGRLPLHTANIIIWC